jgi:hypothetical protein
MAAEAAGEGPGAQLGDPRQLGLAEGLGQVVVVVGQRR